MYQKILVPVDGSETSYKGLDEAIAVARLTHGRLRILHIVDELSFALAMDAYSGYAGDWLAELRSQGNRVLEACRSKVAAAGIEVETVLHDSFDGTVHEFVNKEAAEWPADLIVLGTHGRRGVGRLVMGSSAERILRLATVPVLLVRAPEQAPEAAEPAKPEAAEKGLHVHLPSGALAFE